MGGPKREFFRLFAENASESAFFQGGECKVFSSNVHGIQVFQIIYTCNFTLNEHITLLREVTTGQWGLMLLCQ